MTTQTPAAAVTEVERLHRFLGQQIAAGHTDLTVAQALEQFQAYLHDIERLREELRPAMEEVAGGEYGPIDWDAFLQRADERLRERGVPE